MCFSALHRQIQNACSQVLPAPFTVLAVGADFEGTAASLGKPALNDIAQGLVTAPVLFAAQQYPVLLPIMERKFGAPGDVDTALRFVSAADGLAATRRLAIAHGQLALNAIAQLGPSPARSALAALVVRVLTRNR